MGIVIAENEEKPSSALPRRLLPSAERVQYTDKHYARSRALFHRHNEYQKDPTQGHLR